MRFASHSLQCTRSVNLPEDVIKHLHSCKLNKSRPHDMALRLAATGTRSVGFSS